MAAATTNAGARTSGRFSTGVAAQPLKDEARRGRRDHHEHEEAAAAPGQKVAAERRAAEGRQPQPPAEWPRRVQRQHDPHQSRRAQQRLRAVVIGESEQRSNQRLAREHADNERRPQPGSAREQLSAENVDRKTKERAHHRRECTHRPRQRDGPTARRVRGAARRRRSPSRRTGRHLSARLRDARGTGRTTVGAESAERSHRPGACGTTASFSTKPDRVVPEDGVVGDADPEREGDAGEHCEQPRRRAKVDTGRPAPHGTSIVSSAMAEHSTIKA